MTKMKIKENNILQQGILTHPAKQKQNKKHSAIRLDLKELENKQTRLRIFVFLFCFVLFFNN